LVLITGDPPPLPTFAAAKQYRPAPKFECGIRNPASQPYHAFAGNVPGYVSVNPGLLLPKLMNDSAYHVFGAVAASLNRTYKYPNATTKTTPATAASFQLNLFLLVNTADLPDARATLVLGVFALDELLVAIMLPFVIIVYVPHSS
jgi:hypothetical protein